MTGIYTFREHHFVHPHNYVTFAAWIILEQKLVTMHLSKVERNFGNSLGMDASGTRQFCPAILSIDRCGFGLIAL